jgi:glycosyltransferase 2 family protein
MDIGHRRNTGRTWLRVVIGILVAVLFLWLIFRRVDARDVTRHAIAVGWPTVVVALGFLTIEYALRIVRWWVMLRTLEPRIALRSCAWPLLVSFAINNLAPLRAGDIVRIVGFREHLRLTAVQLLGTLIIERLLDLTVLLAFLLVGLGTLKNAGIPAGYLQITAALVGAAVLSWVALLLIRGGPQRLILRVCSSERLRKLGLTASAERHIRGLGAALTLVRSPRVALRLFAISGAVWICDGAIFAAIALRLGYTGRPFGPWFALSTATIATLIPSSPGYVGTFDYFAIAGLVAYGASRAVAAAVAFVVHALFWVSLTVVGLTYFIRRRSPQANHIGLPLTRDPSE